MTDAMQPDPLKLADWFEDRTNRDGLFAIKPAERAFIARVLREFGAKPAEVAADVGERVARAIAATQVADLIFLCPGKTFRSLFTRDVTRPLLPRLADAALSALRPGDVVPAGVVVPREPEITEELVGEMLNVFAEADPEDVKNLGHLAWAMGCSNGLIDSYMARGRLALAAVARRLAAIQEPPHAD